MAAIIAMSVRVDDMACLDHKKKKVHDFLAR